MIFQPALPMRGVTLHGRGERRGAFISTRAPHAGSDGEPLRRRRGVLGISTRTPHAGSDRNIMRKFTASINI